MSAEDDPPPYFMMFAAGIPGKVVLGLVNATVGELAAFSPEAAAELGDVPMLYAVVDARNLDGLIATLRRLKATVGESE